LRVFLYHPNPHPSIHPYSVRLADSNRRKLTGEFSNTVICLLFAFVNRHPFFAYLSGKPNNSFHDRMYGLARIARLDCSAKFLMYYIILVRAFAGSLIIYEIFLGHISIPNFPTALSCSIFARNSRLSDLRGKTSVRREKEEHVWLSGVTLLLRTTHVQCIRIKPRK